MKRCPQCNRTYSDDALSFCLDDGSPLVSATAPSSLDPSATSNFRRTRHSPPPTIPIPDSRRRRHHRNRRPPDSDASCTPEAQRLPWLLGWALFYRDWTGILIFAITKILPE
jgi:hypothetical protein